MLKGRKKALKAFLVVMYISHPMSCCQRAALHSHDADHNPSYLLHNCTCIQGSRWRAQTNATSVGLGLSHDRFQFRRPSGVARTGVLARSLSRGSPRVLGGSAAFLARAFGSWVPGTGITPSSSWRRTFRRELWTRRLSPTS